MPLNALIFKVCVRTTCFFIDIEYPSGKEIIFHSPPKIARTISKNRLKILSTLSLVMVSVGKSISGLVASTCVKKATLVIRITGRGGEFWMFFSVVYSFSLKTIQNARPDTRPDTRPDYPLVHGFFPHLVARRVTPNGRSGEFIRTCQNLSLENSCFDKPFRIYVFVVRQPDLMRLSTVFRVFAFFTWKNYFYLHRLDPWKAWLICNRQWINMGLSYPPIFLWYTVWYGSAWLGTAEAEHSCAKNERGTIVLPKV